MPNRSLSIQHRKAISEGLKEHHKRKRRGKTFLGRIANRFTKTRREQRNGKTAQINAHIKDIRDNITELRADLKKTEGNKMAFYRRKQVKATIEHLTQQIEQLKKQRQSIRG